MNAPLSVHQYAYLTTRIRARLDEIVRLAQARRCPSDVRHALRALSVEGGALAGILAARADTRALGEQFVALAMQWLETADEVMLAVQ